MQGKRPSAKTFRVTVGDNQSISMQESALVSVQATPARHQRNADQATHTPWNMSWSIALKADAVGHLPLRGLLCGYCLDTPGRWLFERGAMTGPGRN